MKVVILAGGLGTRFSEETIVKPKPLIKIGGMPILWHIMKIYSAYGFKDFTICAGYKHEHIKNFFLKYFFFKSDIEFNIKKNKFKIFNNKLEDWNVRVINTGNNSNTGGRAKNCKGTSGAQPLKWNSGAGIIKRVKITGSGTKNYMAAK